MAKEKKAPGKKKKKGGFSTFILVVLFLVGAAVLAYPTVSDWWNTMHTSRAIASYVEAVEDMSAKEREEMLEAAREYNKRLAQTGVHFMASEAEIAEYYSLLDITGTGIMGYIQIPTINVNLPIYHGTGEEVLQIAVGHLEGTSLPVGGENTHAALSGHRGLPSATLFTHLDRVVEGDTFTITVYGEVMTYQVDQIRIVLPAEVQDLTIEPGEDHVTLITCTPYGVNSHRMLVRGRRIETLAGDVHVDPDAVKIPTYTVMLAVGIPLLFIVQAIILLVYGRKKPGKTYREMLDDFKNQP